MLVSEIKHVGNAVFRSFGNGKCSVREVYSSVSYTKYLGAQSMYVRDY